MQPSLARTRPTSSPNRRAPATGAAVIKRFSASAIEPLPQIISPAPRRVATAPAIMPIIPARHIVLAPPPAPTPPPRTRHRSPSRRCLSFLEARAEAGADAEEQRFWRCKASGGDGAKDALLVAQAREAAAARSAGNRTSADLAKRDSCERLGGRTALWPLSVNQQTPPPWHYQQRGASQRRLASLTCEARTARAPTGIENDVGAALGCTMNQLELQTNGRRLTSLIDGAACGPVACEPAKWLRLRLESGTVR